MKKSQVNFEKLLVTWTNDWANGNCHISDEEIRLLIAKLDEIMDLMALMPDYKLAVHCLDRDIYQLADVLHLRKIGIKNVNYEVRK